MGQTIEQPTPADAPHDAPVTPGVESRSTAAPAVPPTVPPHLPESNGRGASRWMPRMPKLERPQRTPMEPRHGAPGSRRASRRTRVVVRKVGPLSVLKFSLIFYFCVMLIVYLALLIIYIVLSAAGAIDSLAKILGYVFGSGESTSGPTPVVINGQEVFTWLFIAGVIFTVVWSLVNVFVAFLYNLISDIIGGIEVTLAERSQR
jgi:hypothetical protein